MYRQDFRKSSKNKFKKIGVRMWVIVAIIYGVLGLLGAIPTAVYNQ